MTGESHKRQMPHFTGQPLILMADAQDWDADTIATVRKYALQNAVEYDGAGQAGSVLGRLLGERADLRGRAHETLRYLVCRLLLEKKKKKKKKKKNVTNPVIYLYSDISRRSVSRAFFMETSMMGMD